MYPLSYFVFFFNDTATTEIYTLSLHDALPISVRADPVRLHPPGDADGSPADVDRRRGLRGLGVPPARERAHPRGRRDGRRSEEHTSELQSPCNLVCRLLLEKKKKI